MAEVLGSAEVDVVYKSKQGQLRNEIDQEARKAEQSIKGVTLGDVKGGGTTQLRGEIDKLVGSSRTGSVALGALGNAEAAAGAEAGALVNPLLAVGTALAVGVGVAVKSVDAYVSLADAVREVAERSGATADEASRLVAVTDDYEISSTTAANAAFFLGRAISTNEDGLTKLGVVVDKNADGSTNLTGTLVNVADAYARTTDAGRRAELVQTALGRQGRELIPILEQGGQALQAMFAETPEGQLLDEKDLARAREYKLAVDNLHDVWQEFSVEIGQSIVPALADLVDFLAESVRWVDKLAKPVGGLIGLLSILPGPGNALALGQAWGKVKDEMDGAGDSADGLGSSLDDLGNQVDDVFRATLDLIDAEAGQTRARFGMEDAADRVAEATERYNDALHRTGKYAEDVAKATDKVRSAENALIEARERAIKAEDDRAEAVDAVNEAEFRFGRQSREANEARDDLRDKTFAVDDAHRALTDAQEKATDAQKDLADAQARGGTNSKELAGATRDLERAQFAQTEQARKAAEADVKVADAQAAINGETLTANERLAIYNGKLGELERAAAEGSPLRTALAGLRTELDAIGTTLGVINGLTPATVSSLAALQGAGAITPGALGGPGTVDAGALGGAGTTGAGGLSSGAVGVGSLSSGPAVNIENLNVNNNVDAQQLPYTIAWEASGVR